MKAIGYHGPFTGAGMAYDQLDRRVDGWTNPLPHRRRRPELTLRAGLLWGAAAGAAGTTCLNTVTYLDMALRGRRASSTPQDSVEKLSERMHVRIPGDGETRANRVAGLGPLLGMAAGAGVGALLGLARAAGWRPGLLASSGVAVCGAMFAGNGPMKLLGITDPRSWSATDWTADAVPHLAYGAVTAAVLQKLTEPCTATRTPGAWSSRASSRRRRTFCLSAAAM
jgi:hypothetical protein